MFTKLGVLVSATIFYSHQLMAAPCTTTVVSGGPKIGPMAYDTKEIVIPQSCKKFKITLVNNNPAAMTKAAMGHNIVIVSAAKLQNVATKGITAGLAANYVAKDSGYLVASKVIGPGEKDSIEFETKKIKGTPYKFFCSCPGHAGVMVGDIKIAGEKVN